jgi:LmbE family N-acetylglucosaminyl deacetylase
MVIIAIGPHPDDPEEGMGGTIARIKGLNGKITDEKIIIVYMTSGGAGIGGKSQAEATKIREQEAKNACKILKAEPIFLHQIDGSAFPTQETVKQLADLFEKEEPRIIFTCWPLDSHPDHRATAYMVITAYSLVYGNSFASSIVDPLSDQTDSIGIPGLFFWATEPWLQSLQFYPDCLVNIDTTIDIKMEAIEAHASQNTHDHLVKYVEDAAIGFGKQTSRAKYAEGFMRLRPGAI